MQNGGIEASKQNWLVGYGSLMSHDSRLRFTDIDAQGIPVHISGWQRAWSMCCPIENFTCVGAIPNSDNSDSNVGGIMVPIEEITDRLRKREQNYHFVALEKERIRHHCESQREQLQILLEDAMVWICQVNSPGKAAEGFPIYQSYVDTCLSGCLESVGEAFAVQFIEETALWDGHWLNDRAAPQYPRAAKVASETQRRIDKLLYRYGLLRFRIG